MCNVPSEGYLSDLEPSFVRGQTRVERLHVFYTVLYTWCGEGPALWFACGEALSYSHLPPADQYARFFPFALTLLC